MFNYGYYSVYICFSFVSAIKNNSTNQLLGCLRGQGTPTSVNAAHKAGATVTEIGSTTSTETINDLEIIVIVTGKQIGRAHV